jgi:hypothetical protein
MASSQEGLPAQRWSQVFREAATRADSHGGDEGQGEGDEG